MSQQPEDRATDRPEVVTAPAEPRGSRLPSHLGRARTSTVVLSVLFLAVGALYLNVRPDPVRPATTGGGGTVEQPATPPPSVAPTTTAPPTTPPPTTPTEPTPPAPTTTETTEAPDETSPTPTSDVPTSPEPTVEPPATTTGTPPG